MQKVSIITPVYNGEKFIDSYMKSVLSQTYENIELIIVNDGSIDATASKILSYTAELENRGIEFKYVEKKNGGQPSAINAGLKIFSGELLTWPDIDDRMHDDYIEKKVAYFEQHPDVDYLVTPSMVVDINDSMKVIGRTWEIRPTSDEDMLYRIVNDVHYSYEPGNFMVTAEIIRKSIPNLNIYDACGKWSGPQIQMMLPVIYNGHMGYLDKCLFDYCVHDNQDHNKYKSKDELKIKSKEGRKMILETISTLDAPKEQKEELINQAEIRMARSEMRDAVRFLDYEWYRDAFYRLDKEHRTYKDNGKLVVLKYALLRTLYSKKNCIKI
jgi:glycosyltransferase involved in cell wall biosynthesis